jgi:tripeptidyl-peptidase-1
MWNHAILLLAVSTQGLARVTLEPGKYAQPNVRWTREPTPPARNASMALNFMLKHEASDVQRLEKTLLAVSDPDSPRYGQFLTLEEVDSMIPISAKKHKAVEALLAQAPEAKMSKNLNGDIYEVVLSVQSVERLFQTTVATFTHEDGVQLLRAATEHSVPDEVAGSLALVGDLASLPRISQPLMAELRDKVTNLPNWPNSDCASGCGLYATPAVLKDRYKVPASASVVPNKTKNSMAVAEFQGQGFTQADLDQFNSNCGTQVKVDRNVGGTAPAGVEAELDIEYIGAVANGVPLTVVYSATFSLLAWVKTITSMEDTPLVHSVSYGNDEKQQQSSAYIFSCNTQFMAAGARGLSILFASGDQGVCGREGCGVFFDRFKPDFPADSPYITAVGATNFAEASTVGEEAAWVGSGGGFSDYFPIPSWQASAVSGYKTSGTKLPEQKLWNNTGRGYPDIAALGGEVNPYCVTKGGVNGGVYGTSAACPTAAAIFARVNGELMAAGASPLGWLNPFIYKNPTAFQDVTKGNNKCDCSLFWAEGFTATAGWDPTTGMGTPDYTKILAAAQKAKAN